MARSVLVRTLSAVLSLGVVLPALAGVPAVHASATRQSAPPTFIDSNRPAVSGTLVARPLTAVANVPAICRDESAIRGAATQNRGLVICTEEGKLVLLQLTARTRFFSRDWRRIAVDRLRVGDHINAWGTLRDSGHLLFPTSVVQDTSITAPPPPRTVTVVGILVAKPVNGEATIPPACQDRNQAAVSQAVQQNRGLVVCTGEGRLVLLQLSSGTRIVSRDGRLITVSLLTDGDHITARGTLKDNGHLLDPTLRVQDTDL